MSRGGPTRDQYDRRRGVPTVQRSTGAFVTAGRLHLLVPGPLDQWTGGYVYDSRMAAGLRRFGWTVDVHSLEGEFPEGDPRAEASLAETLALLPDGARVLIDGLGMGALPATVARHAGRLRILGLVHHPLADETGIEERTRAKFEALEREALAACAGVIATSRFTCERLVAYGLPRARLRAVPPGTDPARLVAGPEPGQPPRLVCVAALIPRKGHDVLLRALERIRAVPWTCACAGSLDRAPDYSRAVLAQSKAAGLEGRIEFSGECDVRTLDDIYHGASLFVLPSWYEGYGMVFAEALVRGLPVVSTTGGAIPQTVPGSAGFLVPPGDDVALAEALVSLLAGSAGAARRARLATEARKHALKLPGWDYSVGLLARSLLELAPD